MLRWEKILVATDFSPSAEEAQKIVRYADRPVLVLPGPGRGWTMGLETARGASKGRKRSSKGENR